MAKLCFGAAPTSVILRVKLMNSSVTTGAGLTGLSSASSGLIISTIQIQEATATTYTVAGSTIETISTLGTYAAPTATKCRFKEVDATNHPGVYEIQLADARLSGCNSIIISILGATNLAQADFEIQTNLLADGTAGTASFKNLTINNSGGSAIVATSSGSNGSGINATGNGTGAGIITTGGATGNGISSVGGATSGKGMYIHASAGNSVGLDIDGSGTQPGMQVVGGATGNGLQCTGGTTSGDGIAADAPTSGHGIDCSGTNGGSGMELTGEGGGAGLHAIGGDHGGSGIEATGDTTAGGGERAGIYATGLHGLQLQGSLGGNGLRSTGEAAGAGIYSVGGATGNGVTFSGGASGHGIYADGGDDKNGIYALGGATGHAVVFDGGTSQDALRLIGGTGSGYGAYIEGTADSAIYVNGNGGAGIYVSSNTDGMIIESLGGSGTGLIVRGNGTGAGFSISGGDNGNGLVTSGGAVSGHGFRSIGKGLAGHGITCVRGGVSGHDLNFETPDCTIPVVTDVTNSVSGGISASDVWSYADRQLTAFDEDITSIDIDTVIIGSVAGSVASVTGSVGSIASGGITAASIATDAINEIQSGLSTLNASGVWTHPDRQLTAFDEDITVIDINNTTIGTVNSIGLTAITSGSFSTNSITANALADDAIDEIVADILATPTNKLVTDASGRVDIGAIYGDATSAEKLSHSADTMKAGTVDTSVFAATVTEFEAADVTEASTGHWKDRWVVFKTGALIGQAKPITAYTLTGGKGHFTVEDLADVPSNGDTFEIV